MYTALHSIYRRLPPSWRESLKRSLGSEGHGQSNMDWLTARKDAAGKKRLDRAIKGVIDTMGQEAAQQISGKVCIDFGAGYVPTDGIALWLLGANQVYGVDYNDIAKPKEMARAVIGADVDEVRSLLSALHVAPQWAERLDTLLRWAHEGKGGFPPGYRYLAPADAIASPSTLPNFDVLVSTSVLEHIPPSLIAALLDALTSRENTGGARQFHRVDLRDHRDFASDPYGFLDPSRHFDAEAEADSRGNGMTFHDWESLLAEHSAWELAVHDFQAGRPHLMPSAASMPQTHVVADSVVLRTVRGESALKNHHT